MSDLQAIADFTGLSVQEVELQHRHLSLTEIMCQAAKSFPLLSLVFEARTANGGSGD